MWISWTFSLHQFIIPLWIIFVVWRHHTALPFLACFSPWYVLYLTHNSQEAADYLPNYGMYYGNCTLTEWDGNILYCNIGLFRTILSVIQGEIQNITFKLSSTIISFPFSHPHHHYHSIERTFFFFWSFLLLFRNFACLKVVRLFL